MALGAHSYDGKDHQEFGGISSLIVTLTFFTFSLWSFVRLFLFFGDSWESWSALEIVVR